jgi:hypothetical protein
MPNEYFGLDLYSFLLSYYPGPGIPLALINGCLFDLLKLTWIVWYESFGLY